MTATRLDTGQRPLWTPDRRQELGRCRRCEWHTATQGHHNDCPDRPATATTAPYGICHQCQQPRTALVGVDYKGRPACVDCAQHEGGQRS